MNLGASVVPGAVRGKTKSTTGQRPGDRDFQQYGRTDHCFFGVSTANIQCPGFKFGEGHRQNVSGRRVDALDGSSKVRSSNPQMLGGTNLGSPTLLLSPKRLRVLWRDLGGSRHNQRQLLVFMEHWRGPAGNLGLSDDDGVGSAGTAVDMDVSFESEAYLRQIKSMRKRFETMVDLSKVELRGVARAGVTPYLETLAEGF